MYETRMTKLDERIETLRKKVRELSFREMLGEHIPEYVNACIELEMLLQIKYDIKELA